CFLATLLLEVFRRERLDLLVAGEHVVVGVGVGVPVAVLRAVAAADRRAVLINAAAVVRQQRAALAVDLQVPVAVLDKDLSVFVQQVPAQVLEVPSRLGLIDLQREISATQRDALAAEAFTAS